jgi:hypothetical protein
VDSSIRSGQKLSITRYDASEHPSEHLTEAFYLKLTLHKVAGSTYLSACHVVPG